ncbi:MAG: hypothetical protein KDA79_17170 [Planctomycetaceae bacterium]|nr:hypothetical protein [Planctomycetaceae bacterium]
MNIFNTRLMLLTITLRIFGCSSDSADDEYRRLVEDLSRQQVAQQEALIQQSQDLTEASKQLVDADATARRELSEMQSRLQQEFASGRQSIDGQRQKLDNERREIATQRHRDPLIATALLQTVTLIVAALPLVLLLLLIRATRNEPVQLPLAELLVEDLVAEKPLLFPGPVSPQRALISPDEPAESPDTPDVGEPSDRPTGSDPET